MKHLREAERRKRPQEWRKKTWMLHHGNALAHAPLLVPVFLAKHDTTVVPKPSSPDLAFADFILFPRLKFTLKSYKFQAIE
jgi:hypothetical protein